MRPEMNPGSQDRISMPFPGTTMVVPIHERSSESISQHISRHMFCCTRYPSTIICVEIMKEKYRTSESQIVWVWSMGYLKYFFDNWEIHETFQNHFMDIQGISKKLESCPRYIQWISKKIESCPRGRLARVRKRAREREKERRQGCPLLP